MFYYNCFTHYFCQIRKLIAYDRLRNLIASAMVMFFNILEAFICLNSTMKLEEFDAQKKINVLKYFNLISPKYKNK